MIFTPHACPKCGEPANGVSENVPGVALMTYYEDGEEFEYDGETRMGWDGQTMQLDNEGKAELWCENGHSWAATIGEEAEAPAPETTA